MIEALLNNAEKLDNIGLIWFMVWTIIFQWWLIIHLYKENKKENKILVDINNNVIKQFEVMWEVLKDISSNNAKLNERIDYYFIKK